MGSQLAGAKSAGATRARPRRARATTLGSARRCIRWAGSSAGLGRPVTRVGRRPSRRRDRFLPSPRSDRRIARPHPLPSRQFQALFDSLFKVLFIFPSRYLFAIGLSALFSLGPNLLPYLGCIPKQPDSPTTPSRSRRSGHNGAVTLSGPHSMGLAPGPSAKGASANYNSNGEKPLDSHLGLFPVRSPLLGESIGCTHLTWGRNPSKASDHGGDCRQGPLLEPGPRTRLEPRRGQGAEPSLSSCEVPLGQSVFQPISPAGARATNLLRPDDPPSRPRWGRRGRGSGRTRRRGAQVTVFEVGRHGHAAGDRLALPLSLGTDRAEWMFVCWRPGPSGAADAEPVGAGREREARGFDGRFAPGRAPVAAGHRVQLVRLGRARFVESTMILPQVQWTSRNVIGGEPPMSPRSEHFTGPFNRQIAPPTKNGHAPPPIESRKSSQSVNPYYVGRGITTAAGIGLALQWILVMGFRLYSFQLPDSESPILFFIVTTSPCQDWVICEPAAFLGCGSRFSGSLSGIEP
ncbi:hypothetical protein H6P81_016068 [Aristolochia fimbriata]|uniref:Uncharacterized protein n=1 Tax=Aristolochia fimbriata TaxID=158543 RepID=A0AAV7E7C4_ARIFI|nr:hypothetical protein H6P81_016068 [Aristolochia fimbriata]